MEFSRIFNSMEVQTVNNLHNTAAILSSLQGTAANPSPSPKKMAANAGSASAKQSSTEAAILEQLNKQQQQQKQQQVANLSRDCESPSSSNSELEKEFELQDMNGSLTGSGSVGKSNGSLSGASSTNSAPPGGNAVASSGVANANATNNTGSTNGAQSSNTIAAQLKKRISSSRTPTRKAHRIKFYRNGDRFYPGITIPVSNERYRSFESLYEDLTRLLEENVKIPGAVRTIYNMCGKKVSRTANCREINSYL